MTKSLRDAIEEAAEDDALSMAEHVVELCDALETIAGLAHEDGSRIAHRALEAFKKQLGRRLGER
jgi:hypothetical protein